MPPHGVYTGGWKRSEAMARLILGHFVGDGQGKNERDNKGNH